MTASGWLAAPCTISSGRLRIASLELSASLAGGSGLSRGHQDSVADVKPLVVVFGPDCCGSAAGTADVRALSARPPGLGAGAADVAGHRDPRVGVVVGAVDAGHVHARHDQIFHQRIVGCRAGRKRDHDPHIPALGRRPERLFGVHAQQLVAAEELLGDSDDRVLARPVQRTPRRWRSPRRGSPARAPRSAPAMTAPTASARAAPRAARGDAARDVVREAPRARRKRLSDDPRSPATN